MMTDYRVRIVENRGRIPEGDGVLPLSPSGIIVALG